GVCPEGLAVDARRLGVGLAADLLRPPLAVGEDAPLLALGLAVDLGAAPGAFGAELLGDALALGDHPILDLAADLVDVVEALDAHVDQLDAERRDHLL